jgi:hypothetical protein
MELNHEPRTVRIPEHYITYFDTSLESHVLCSNCRAPLFDIIPKRECDRVNKITATCPHCGDKSFQKTINGEFFYGNTEYTIIGNIEMVKSEMGNHQPCNKLSEMNYCEAIVHTKKIKDWSN